MVKEIDRLGLRHPNKHPVFELFELYKKNWVDGTHNAYYIIQEWLDSYADEKMLYKNITWDDYYLQLWRGELVKDFCVNDLKLPKYADQRTYMFRNDFKAIPYENECYPYGCCINKFMISDYRDIDLSGKELVIKQDTPGLASYLIWASDENKDSNKYNIYQRDQEAFDASIEDSIVIRGKELEALRMSNGSFSHRLYVITTNTYSYLSLTDAIRGWNKTSHVTVELRDTLTGPMIKISEDTIYVTKGAAKVQVEVKTNCKDIQIQNYRQWIQASLSEAIPNTDTRTLTLDVKANPSIIKRGVDIILLSWEEEVLVSDTLHVTQAATAPPNRVTVTFSGIEAHMKGEKHAHYHYETNRNDRTSSDEDYPETIDNMKYIFPVEFLNKEMKAKCSFENDMWTISLDSIDLRKDPNYDPNGSWTATSPAGEETSTTNYRYRYFGHFSFQVDLSQEQLARLVSFNAVVEEHLMQKTTGTWSTPRNPGPGLGLDSKAVDYVKEDGRYSLSWVSGHEKEYEDDPYPIYLLWGDELPTHGLGIGLGRFGPWASASRRYEKYETGEGIEYDVYGTPAWRDYTETHITEETKLVPDGTGNGSVNLSW